MENHTVTVEADHPGWIQLLQFRQGQLLAGIQTRFPALEVRALQFRLTRKGGDTAPARRETAPEADGTGEPGEPETAPPLRLDPDKVEDEALRDALSGLRDAFEGR